MVVDCKGNERPNLDVLMISSLIIKWISTVLSYNFYYGVQKDKKEKFKDASDKPKLYRPD